MNKKYEAIKRLNQLKKDQLINLAKEIIHQSEPRFSYEINLGDEIDSYE